MRPTPPRTGSHDFDDLPSDLSFDAPPSDFVGEASPYNGVDVLPEAHGEAFQDPRARGRKPGRKPPLDLVAPVRREVSARAAVPTSVCLACGASPPDGGDCPHDEVAHLTDAPDVLLVTLRRLQAAVAERHAQERALRRLVAAEVSAGRGDIDVPTRALTSVSTEPESATCTRCGHRPTQTRAARRKALLEAQSTFFFAVPPPPEPTVETPVEATVEAPVEGAQTVAEAPPPRKRGRPRKADAALPAAAPIVEGSAIPQE
jgi:hypothetical protein